MANKMKANKNKTKEWRKKFLRNFARLFQDLLGILSNLSDYQLVHPIY